MSGTAPGIGHNNPPPLVVSAAEIATSLLDSEGALLKRRDELQAGALRFQASFPEIKDDETYGLAGDFAKQIQTAINVADDHFKSIKRPFIDGGRAVDAFFAALRGPLTAALADVKKPMTAYALKLEEEERRKRVAAADAARREAERAQAALAASKPEASIETAIVHAQQAERTEKAAAAPSADLTRRRGDLGSVNSLREVWDVELEDLSKVPLEYLTFNEAAARKAVQGGKIKTIPGVRVFTRKHVVTR